MTRTPPADIRRALRREVGFVCPVPGCTNPYLTRHHFDPIWRVREHHEPGGLIALCRDHHSQADEVRLFESVKFDFLGVYRPAVILGNSNTPGMLGYFMPLLHWAMPSKYRSIHKNDLARAIVAQSEQAFLAIAQGNARKGATVKILEYTEMEP